MTYSILAYDPLLGQAGISTVSGSIAVGSRVPWGRHGIGVVATQAYTNPALAPMILEYLSKAMSAEEALRRALQSDPSPAHRQVAVVDYRGDVAVHDGEWSPSWHGYYIHPREPVVCIANLVRGPDVCREAVNAFMDTRGTLAEKLLAAIEAGHRAGGDRRGDKSAALLVVGQTEYAPYYDRVIDLRVDYAPDPIRELKRIYSLLVEGY
ncbi:DUF1028 domain-containing protein [Hyperthermus butylicus]|uniref:DUF1028 protein n=1 Tax=Hyperthermus butylicus (strain DSM 5456 / JCM 9403 / PLM1-5) TaxID=415426 RepID=A2BIX7_HYPBU|nr:DUF1028 domain-containing protein [Hyperthermus butylicus]ABM79938.1 putative DUF1028 protein [Hyperthermus butylicus DSM 5456]